MSITLRFILAVVLALIVGAFYGSRHAPPPPPEPAAAAAVAVPPKPKPKPIRRDRPAFIALVLPEPVAAPPAPPPRHRVRPKPGFNVITPHVETTGYEPEKSLPRDGHRAPPVIVNRTVVHTEVVVRVEAPRAVRQLDSVGQPIRHYPIGYGVGHHQRAPAPPVIIVRPSPPVQPPPAPQPSPRRRHRASFKRP